MAPAHPPEDRTRVVRLHAELASGRRPALTIDYRLRGDDGRELVVAVDAYAVPAKEQRRKDARVRMDVIGCCATSRNAAASMKSAAASASACGRRRSSRRWARSPAASRTTSTTSSAPSSATRRCCEGATEPGSKARKYSDTIASAGERGKALVAQILAFSRSTEQEKHPVDLRSIVDEVVATLAGSLPTNIRVHQEVSSEPCVAFGNATHLYQLIMNLSTNAMQAMPQGGELRIALGRIVEVPAERMLAGGPLAAGRYHTLEIEDQGTGIDPAVIGRIFEPFFSTKEMGKGTGLGLAIAHGVTLSHGGGIDIESRMDEGTTFVVYLPVHAGAAAPLDRERAEVPRGNGETILVVDDEPALVELSQDLLAELGYEPVGYTSSVRALAAFQATPQRFAAVLTDEVMPDLTGTELCAQLRAQAESLPILVASGYGGSGFELRAANAGATKILRKPYRKQELGTALAAALARKEPA
jgi:CheY-like chemotaxis protein